jgi:hypothetical protein
VSVLFVHARRGDRRSKEQVSSEEEEGKNNNKKNENKNLKTIWRVQGSGGGGITAARRKTMRMMMLMMTIEVFSPDLKRGRRKAEEEELVPVRGRGNNNRAVAVSFLQNPQSMSVISTSP